MPDTRKKVLIVSDSSKSLMDFRGKLIEELALKHDVCVFTPQISQPGVREKLTSLNVAIHENNLKGSHVSVFSDLLYISQLYRLIKVVKPDVFFSYTFKPVIYGTLLAKLCNVKCIASMLTGLGYNFMGKSRVSPVSILTRMLLKISLTQNLNLKIIFQNKDDYQTLCHHKILSNKHSVFFVNGSGVDLDHYTYSLPPIESISFIMVARLINAKGIYEYYEAARNIKMRYPLVKFKLIGSYSKNIDSISSELYNKIRYGKIIEYVGEVDDVRPHIMNTSVVVLPSYYGEGVPRCLLESMAMGRAIITCDSVGCRETVKQAISKNGFLVPIKNVPLLISKMEFYLNNKNTVLTYGLNGLKLARKKFDVKLVNAQMLKIMKLN